jgi:signal peptidase I
MATLPQSQFPLARLERFLLRKRGLFIAPILSAFIALKVLPVLLLGFLPGLLVAVVYRTVKIPGNKLKVFGASLGVALLSLISVRIFFLELRYVVGEGMSPEIANGSRVLVDKTAYWWPSSPQRGDIIIAKLNVLRDLTTGTIHVMDRQDVKISRIYRLPGENVEVRDGNRYINIQVGNSPKSCTPSETNHREEKPRQFRSFAGARNPFARGIMSECFFLFRDDDPTSNQYEYLAVPQKSIVGKVTAVLWPLQKPQLQPKNPVPQLASST